METVLGEGIVAKKPPCSRPSRPCMSQVAMAGSPHLRRPLAFLQEGFERSDSVALFCHSKFCLLNLGLQVVRSSHRKQKSVVALPYAKSCFSTVTPVQSTKQERNASTRPDG